MRPGALESVAGTRLPRPLAKLVATWPRLRLQLRTDISEPLMKALERGDLDAALVVDAPRTTGVSRVGVYKENLPFVAAAGHDAIKSPDDLADDTMPAFK